jgi:uncharacterized protein YodC (DUF2158 family)
METKTVSKTFNEYEDFNVGDVVRLKSGGPSMTVDGTQGSRLDCTWFESGSNVIHRRGFIRRVGKFGRKPHRPDAFFSRQKSVFPTQF